jgi:hypothetical protein
MPHAYTEDQLVEQPAKAGGPPSPRPSPSGRRSDELFAELGWDTVSGLQNLRRTRDPAAAGLPRLLSGQVEVSESNVKTGAPAA